MRLVLVLLMLVSTASAGNVFDDLVMNYWNDSFLQSPNVYGPGKYVHDLPQWHGDTSDIEEVLSERGHTRAYKLGEFDCSDMSQLAYDALKKRGYNVKVMLNYVYEIKQYHVWLLVEKYRVGHDGKVETAGWVAVECVPADTNNPANELGHIGTKDLYFTGAQFNTTEEWWICSDDRYYGKLLINQGG